MVTIGTARAVADLSEGLVLATVEVAASPERTFEALTSLDVTRWWVRPGVFDTPKWDADVCAGGHWRASGMARGKPYTLKGKFTKVDAPRRLAHTWRGPGGESIVTYNPEPTDGGTRITLRHEGLAPRPLCAATCIGWETSFEQLARMLGG